MVRSIWPGSPPRSTQAGFLPISAVTTARTARMPASAPNLAGLTVASRPSLVVISETTWVCFTGTNRPARAWSAVVKVPTMSTVSPPPGSVTAASAEPATGTITRLVVVAPARATRSAVTGPAPPSRVTWPARMARVTVTDTATAVVPDGTDPLIRAPDGSGWSARRITDWVATEVRADRPGRPVRTWTVAVEQGSP